jgi:hypothetical protein
MGFAGSQPFAMLLCQFADMPSVEPHPKSYYQNLIENTGTGGLADYWAAASLNHIDLKGSKVFDWTPINWTTKNYGSAHVSRWEKIQGVFDAFPGFNLKNYTGVISVFNGDPGDSGNAGNGVLCGPGDTTVTFLGHETGHVFGLAHSFDTSSRKDASWSAPGEYYDMHDIMSAMNVYGDGGSPFGEAGPLLAAPNLDRMGWLDPSRVWTPPLSGGSSQDELDLVSLGHAEVSGYIAAKIGNLYIEFRTKDGWDKAIPYPAVLIHSLREPNAVVLPSDPVNYVNDWQPGQIYEPMTAREALLGGGTWIEVVSFNLQAHTARIKVRNQVRNPIIEGAAQIFGGIPFDGGGWIILPSGRIIRVPPRSPVLEALDKLVAAAETEGLSAEAKRSVERSVFADTVDLLQQLIERENSGE